MTISVGREPLILSVQKVMSRKKKRHKVELIFG